MLCKLWRRTDGHCAIEKFKEHFLSQEVFDQLANANFFKRINKEFLKCLSNFTTTGVNGEVYFKPLLIDGVHIEHNEKKIFLSAEVDDILHKICERHGSDDIFRAIEAAHKNAEHELIKLLHATRKDEDNIVVCGKTICELRPRLFFDKEHWTGELRMVGFEGKDGLFFIEIGLHHQLPSMLLKVIASISANSEKPFDKREFLNDHLKWRLLVERLKLLKEDQELLQTREENPTAKAAVAKRLKSIKATLEILGYQCLNNEGVKSLIEKTQKDGQNSLHNSVVDQIGKRRKLDIDRDI